MARRQEIVELEGRKYRVSEMPPLMARQVLMKWDDSLSKNDLGEENQVLFKKILSNVEAETSPNVWLRLDTEDVINDNLSFASMKELGDKVVDLTIGFLKNGENSQS